MKQNVVAPSVGESITEVSILRWAKKEGEAVKTGELLLEIESDKATVEVVAETDGVLQILKPEGAVVPVGEVLGVIDPQGKATIESIARPSEGAGQTSAAKEKPAAASSSNGKEALRSTNAAPGGPTSPAVRKIGAEKGLDLNQVTGSGPKGRITKSDVLSSSPSGSPATAPAGKPTTPAMAPQFQDREGDRRVPMSRLRLRIAERLVHAQQTAAILTTFNEAVMDPVMKLRSRHRDEFQKKHGVKLSFMSFFTRACVEALKAFPDVNASIDGTDIVYHDYIDVGIAVGTDRGLVVPIIRGTEKLGFAEIEKTLGDLANRARAGKLSIADMSGGTFTVSNGGTYGSLLSTPILNPPQTAILGMHAIKPRPYVVEDSIVIRQVMNLALSYDHRLIDGKEAVSFLIKIKEGIENPESLGPIV